MANSPTVWIDMTDLRAWQGNMTGIQRTVYNLAARFASDSSVKFFYYDPAVQNYYKCDFVEAPQQASITPNSSPYTAARKLGAKLPPIIKKPLKKTIRTFKPQQPIRATLEAPFSPGDTIMVLGGNWGDDFKGFIDGLATLKAQRNLRIIHVVYDLLPIISPNFYVPGSTHSYERYLDKLLTFADVLPCISKATQHDLDSLIAKSSLSTKPQTCTFHLGEDMGSADGAVSVRPSTKARLTGPFLLSVGTIEARKNHALLYYVYKEAARQKIALPQMVIAGRRGWMTGDVQNLIDNDPETKEKLFILDDVPDSELAWLYQNCLFAVYASMCEGWGLPLAEAAHYGKLCLASNTSSMPEVMGDTIDYFSPFDPKACLDKILQYVHNPKQLHAKESEIANHHVWSWDDAYQDLKQKLNKTNHG